MLIPENHTRNQFYLQNVAKLVSILRLTGLDVRIGSLLPEIAEPTVLELANGATLTLEPLRRSGSRLGLDNFDPCAVLLNNDLSAGIPQVLKGLDEQWLIPPLHAGWHKRRKSKHAECYDRVAREFASAIGIDPWRINPEFGVCGQINFQERTGEECLAGQVDSLLTRIRAKYKEYGVTDEPFVVVKADAGTYGMGVMTVKDASEVVGLNRRQRNKMAVVKEGLQVHEVIIQEGVHTFETVEDGVAEPVVLHDGPLRGGRLLPRAHRARPRREPQRARHALQAARLRHQRHHARRRPGPGCAAEPFLRLRRGRAPGAARGLGRDRGDRAGRGGCAGRMILFGPVGAARAARV